MRTVVNDKILVISSANVIYDIINKEVFVFYLSNVYFRLIHDFNTNIVRNKLRNQGSNN